MKQEIILAQNTVSSLFIKAYKACKKYPNANVLLLGEAIEILAAVSTNLHKEYSDGRFFNWVLMNTESSIAWDGEQLLDILFFEIEENVKRRLNT